MLLKKFNSCSVVFYNTVIKAYEAHKETGVSYADYFGYKLSLDDYPTQKEMISALNSSNLTKSQKSYIFEQRYENSKNNP